MTPWEIGALWLSGFINVLLLGLQSRNAIAGRYVRCAFLSFFIGTFQVFAWRAAAHEDPLVVSLIIGSSGAAGICTAIWLNTRAGLGRL